MKKTLVFVAILVVVVLGGFLIGKELSTGNNSSGTASTQGNGSPKATPSSKSPTATPTPTLQVTGSGCKNLKLPSGIQVQNEAGQPTQAVAQSWVLAAVRSQCWRFYAVTTGQEGIEDTLMDGNPRADIAFGTMFDLVGQGKKGTVTGSFDYQFGVGLVLDGLGESDLAQIGDTGASGDVVILVEDVQGPVSVQFPGQSPMPMVGVTGEQVILVGQMVDDPTLGEIWQSSFVYQCTEGDTVALNVCHS